MGMFQKATKKQSKLRLALFGVSGGGKSYGALRIATGLGGRIAAIDTEHGSLSKYSDRFEFDVCNLEKPSINNLLLCMEQAKDYDVLIIDSLTHAWNELLQENESVARARYSGNTWSAWSDSNKKQSALINAILNFPGHIICTMRAETNWTVTTNDKGKVTPIRVGEAPKQGKSIEYEFDMLIQISQEHESVVLKDRTGKFQDKCFTIDEQFGKDLLSWLNDGEVVRQPSKDIDVVDQIKQCQTLEELTNLYNSDPTLFTQYKYLFSLRKEELQNGNKA